MREIADSFLKLWWRTPLLLAEQLAVMISELAKTTGSGGEARFPQVVRRTGPLGEVYHRFVDLAEQVQRRTIDMIFDAATLKPLRESVRDEFPTLLRPPVPGSQK